MSISMSSSIPMCSYSTIGLNVEMLTRMIRSAPNERALVLRKSDDNERLRIESDEDCERGFMKTCLGGEYRRNVIEAI